MKTSKFINGTALTEQEVDILTALNKNPMSKYAAAIGLNSDIGLKDNINYKNSADRLAKLGLLKCVTQFSGGVVCAGITDLGMSVADSLEDFSNNEKDSVYNTGIIINKSGSNNSIGNIEYTINDIVNELPTEVKSRYNNELNKLTESVNKKDKKQH